MLGGFLTAPSGPQPCPQPWQWGGCSFSPPLLPQVGRWVLGAPPPLPSGRAGARGGVGGGIPRGWLCASLQAWHKQSQPQHGSPGLGMLGAAARSAHAAPPAPGSGGEHVRPPQHQASPAVPRRGLPAAAAWQLGTNPPQNPLPDPQRWGIFPARSCIGCCGAPCTTLGARTHRPPARSDPAPCPCHGCSPAWPYRAVLGAGSESVGLGGAGKPWGFEHFGVRCPCVCSGGWGCSWR